MLRRPVAEWSKNYGTADRKEKPGLFSVLVCWLSWLTRWQREQPALLLGTQECGEDASERQRPGFILRSVYLPVGSIHSLKARAGQPVLLGSSKEGGTSPWGTTEAGCWWMKATMPRPRLSPELWRRATPRPGRWCGRAGMSARRAPWRARSTARSRATGTSRPPCRLSSLWALCWVSGSCWSFWLILFYFCFKSLRSGTADQKVPGITGCLRDSSCYISGPQVYDLKFLVGFDV